MPFDKKLPKWDNIGVEPPSFKQTEGWAADEHPPASIFNWFFNTVYLALQELQQEAVNTDQLAVKNGVATLDANAKLPLTQSGNIQDWVKGFGLGDVAKDVSSTDLNTLDVTGFYKGENLTNGPTTAAVGTFYFIINIKHSATNKIQIASRYGTGSAAGQLWQRSNLNGTWSAWVQLAVYDTNGKIAVTNLPAATTAAAGISQLSDAIDDTSKTKAATANSVKLLADWVKNQGLGAFSQQANNADLNTLTNNGFYYCLGTKVNSPSAVNGYLTVESYNASYTKQTYFVVNTGEFYTRYKNNGVWGDWAQIETTAGAQSKADAAQTAAINWVKSFGLGDVAKDISNTDLNALDATGFYRGQSLTNAPNAATGFFYIVNIKHNATYQQQMAIQYSGTGTLNVLYTRQKNNNIWATWEQVETTGGATAKVKAHTDLTNNPHKVTTQQVNAFTPPIDGMASGDDLPAGVLVGTVGAGTTGYPLQYGTLVNVRASTYRHFQIFFDTGNGASKAQPYYRMWYTGGGWTDWVQFETTAGAQAKADAAQKWIQDRAQMLKLTNDDGVAISFSGDMDTLKIAGFYYITSTATNRPLNVNGTGGQTGLCEVQQLVSSNGWYQIFTGGSSNSIKRFIRYFTGGSWGVWNEFVKTDDITSEKINFLGTNTKKSDDLASTYPNGITGVYITTLTQGFPSAYGYLLTTSYNTGAGQTYYGAAGDAGKVWIRSTANGAWSPWLQLATTDKAQMYKLTQDDGTAIRPTSGTDLNTIKATGIYYTLAPVNGPVTENGYLHVVVGGSPYLKQIYLPYNQSKMFVRDLQSNGTTWTPWTEFATTDKAQMIKLTQDNGAAQSIPDGTDIKTLNGNGFFIGKNLVGMPNNDQSVYRFVINPSGPTTRTIIATRSGNETYIASVNGGVWTDWEKVVTDKAPTWLNLPLANGVTEYATSSTPQYTKIGNTVYIRGAVKNITTTNVTIATLPAGFRPITSAVSFALPMSNNVGARFARWTINPNGTITLEGTSDNTASSGLWFPVTMSFVAEQ